MCLPFGLGVLDELDAEGASLLTSALWVKSAERRLRCVSLGVRGDRDAGFSVSSVSPAISDVWSRTSLALPIASPELAINNGLSAFVEKSVERRLFCVFLLLLGVLGVRAEFSSCRFFAPSTG